MLPFGVQLCSQFLSLHSPPLAPNLHSRAAPSPSVPAAQKAAPPVDAAEAYRLNTLDVAYMNQQRPPTLKHTLNNLSQLIRNSESRVSTAASSQFPYSYASLPAS
jgi:hypothetical protein